MAFNPFHGFRKHQKVVMAILTIACMFIFVLTGSMAAGFEFFQGITNMFGLSSARGDQVATVYAKPVSSQDLFQLRMQRLIANDFITQTIFWSSQWADQRI